MTTRMTPQGGQMGASVGGSVYQVVDGSMLVDNGEHVEILKRMGFDVATDQGATVEEPAPPPADPEPAAAAEPEEKEEE